MEHHVSLLLQKGAPGLDLSKNIKQRGLKKAGWLYSLSLLFFFTRSLFRNHQLNTLPRCHHCSDEIDWGFFQLARNVSGKSHAARLQFQHE